MPAAQQPQHVRQPDQDDRAVAEPACFAQGEAHQSGADPAVAAIGGDSDRPQHQSRLAAAAGYVAMFARDGLPAKALRITVPVLAITGEQDAPPMRSEAVTRTLGPLCDQLVVTPLADSGHYPMQEMPPLTVALVERFLAS